MVLATDQSPRLEFKAGERIFAAGDPAYYCYQVASGSVEIYLSSGGRREVIATIGPGEVFGEMGVIDSGPRSASAIATEDTVCFVYSAPDLAEQFEADPSKTIEIMKTIIRRLRQSNRRFSSLETEPRTMAERKPVPPREAFPVVGFDQRTLDAIEEWRRTQSPVPSVSEAVRMLVDIGLASISGLTKPPSSAKRRGD